MAVNIHITIIELNALHTKRQNLFQELDAVIHLLMEAKHWGLRKSRNAKIGRAVQQECRDRRRMRSSARKKNGGLGNAPLASCGRAQARNARTLSVVLVVSRMA